MFTLDQGEEHTELRAVKLLEQPTEDIVVVEEVLALCYSKAVERLL